VGRDGVPEKTGPSSPSGRHAHGLQSEDIRPAPGSLQDSRGVRGSHGKAPEDASHHLARFDPSPGTFGDISVHFETGRFESIPLHPGEKYALQEARNSRGRGGGLLERQCANSGNFLPCGQIHPAELDSPVSGRISVLHRGRQKPGAPDAGHFSSPNFPVVDDHSETPRMERMVQQYL